MSLKLFSHNQSAFESAMEMLHDCGKAAVVHPTGTGKSYIGFKLCEQFPDKTICWLSPSEYIYKTQLENLKEDSDGWQPKNVKFFTYAKLMLMNDSELSEIKPDYIILDEFHRCGAEMWGEGVDRLLETYPKVPLLGLTATAIRYLDNQRNMVNELFDGNIASEMTLGEAIVRGILNPPKYVMSVFAYQEDYKKLESRVRRTKSKATRDKAEQYLEALCRALEKADGMDMIFDKHITDRTGKYIVFCSNIDHLREMQRNVAAWFNKIDTKPHVYTAYSLDSATEQEFAAFKKDESDHLKLLFCIDMLNEGVHVENISGVVLFRPTVSPIIYKQQIGRALSAGKTKNPIIFDIVNNIENLYSIGTIQQEMQVAISYYRSLGEDSMIVNDRFEVVDEVSDAKELFDSLNDTLSASWDVMFSYAEQYYHQFGNLEVPRRYKTADGYSLGNWIFTQRSVYNGEIYGTLDEHRIKKLESIGMVWDSVRDISWQRYYASAKRYYEANGDLKVPVQYVDEDGLRLGSWISNLRTYRKDGSQKSYMSSERIALLDAIGMIWDVYDYTWQRNYAAAVEYHRKHGDLNVPKGYVSDDGIRLYLWLQNLRVAYRRNDRANRLSDDQVRMLSELGFEWRSQHDVAWDKGCSYAKAYFDTHGNLDVPTSYKTPDGFKLGDWLSNQREKYATGTMKQERIDRLNQLNMIWTKPDPWEERFALAEQYFKEHGDLEVPAAYTVDGVWLAKWIDEQRQINNGKRKGKTLTYDQIRRLDEIGMRWGKKKDIQWRMQFDDVKEYYEKHGNLDIPKDYVSKHGKKTAQWLERQRKAYAMDELSGEQTILLDSVGFIELCEADDSWELMYPAAKAYYAEHGDLLIPTDYVTDSGLNLGFWISNMRACYKKKKRTRYFTEERIRQLEAIGMVWNVNDYLWRRNYESAAKYYRSHGSLKVPVSYIDENGIKLYAWLKSMKKEYRNKSKRLSERQVAMLNQIGMVW